MTNKSSSSSKNNVTLVPHDEVKNMLMYLGSLRNVAPDDLPLELSVALLAYTEEFFPEDKDAEQIEMKNRIVLDDGILISNSTKDWLREIVYK